MGTLWIPGAERLPCSKAGGAITSTAPPRAVWHTTEAQPGTAAVWSAMIRVLNNKSAEPQVLYDPVTDRLGQFMPLNVSGRALKNDGATQTNRVGRVCIQIEVIAYSSKPFTAYWKPGKNFKALVAALKSWGIAVDVWPAGAPPKFIDSPPHNVPENDRDRKTWLTKGGYFSHSQIPANDHGDPGGVSTVALAAAGRAATPAAPKPPTPTPPVEDEMSAKDVEEGIDNYLSRFYSDKGTGGIHRTQDVAWQAAMKDAAVRQAEALEKIANSLPVKAS